MNFPELFSNSVMDQRLHCMQFLFQINNAMVRCFPRLCNKYPCSRWSCFLCCTLGVLRKKAFPCDQMKRTGHGKIWHIARINFVLLTYLSS